MANQNGTLQLLIRETGRLLRPLGYLLTPEQMRNLIVAELRVELPADAFTQDAFSNSIENGIVAIKQLRSTILELVTAIENDNLVLVLKKSSETIKQIDSIINTLDGIGKQVELLSSSLLPSVSVNLIDYVKKLPLRLLELLTIKYMDDYVINREILELFGILDLQPLPGQQVNPFETVIFQEKLYLNRLMPLLKSPVNYAGSIYGWGHFSFNGQLLLERLTNVFSIFGIPATLIPASPAAPPSLESTLFDIRGSIESNPPGLDMILKIPIFDALEFSYPLSSYFTLEISTTGRFDPGLQISFRPPTAISLRPPEETLNGSLTVRIIGKNPDSAESFLLLGQPGASRIEASLMSFTFGLSAAWNDSEGYAEGTLIAEADISGGKAVLDTSGGDGFILKMLSNRRLEADFQFGASWSPETGLRFKGSSETAIVFPTARSLGPVDFEQIYIGLQLNDDGISLEISGAVSVQLGPLIATIDRLGLEARLSFPEQGGNLGLVDFGIGYKPPTAIGLSVDAEGISGGGFLKIEPPNYAGMMQLSFRNEIELTAFGLITTKLPDGTEGFSLVIQIMAEFQPIQIGLGFALTGVGGLIGINRQLCEEGMRAAFKSHSLNTILFPQNPIKDAVKLIESIQSIMPPKEGYHIIGPMVKMFWGGSVELVHFEIGIFIQLGGPLKIVLIGQAWSLLPNEEFPRLVINVDVLGILDFGEERVAIDATLFDSRILNFTLDGQMALRADWSSGEENFALSVGGFNPRFQNIPPGFPSLRRLMVSIGDNPHLSLTMYLAITTNTLQVGAQLEIWAKESGFTIEGGAGFDALFTFSPFSFVTDVRIWVNVSKWGFELGVWLEFELSGPNPFIASGYAKFKVGWFTKKVRFRKEFGDKVAEPLPVASPLAALKKELENPRSIRFQLPAWATANLVFTKDAESKIDPISDIIISQDAVPLNFPMDRFGGGTPPEAEKELKITAGPDIPDEQPVKSLFAPEQFKNWSTEQRLSAKPFEKYDAGIRFSGEYVIPEDDLVEKREIAFETVLRESKQYLDTLPADNCINIAIRTVCVWRPTAQLLKDWSNFGSKRYYKPLREIRDESNPNFVGLRMKTSSFVIERI
jgi:hypothetical protein